MKILKQILNYLFWIAVSLLAALGYMRIVLGPKPEPATGFMKIFDFLYELILLKVVPIVGSIIAILFILIDIFYLKKKQFIKTRGIIIRFLTIILITLVVGTIHYVLEKVIDII